MFFALPDEDIFRQVACDDAAAQYYFSPLSSLDQLPVRQPHHQRRQMRRTGTVGEADVDRRKGRNHYQQADSRQQNVALRFEMARAIHGNAENPGTQQNRQAEKPGRRHAEKRAYEHGRE